jgi:hypothetical protein
MVSSNEALPQTDDACRSLGTSRSLPRRTVQFGRGKDFCGSDRGFMTSSGKTRLNRTDERSKRLREAKPERPEPRR